MMHLHDIPEKAKTPVTADHGCRKLNEKMHERAFWGDGDVLYLNYGSVS